jgi:hypothetical protein
MKTTIEIRDVLLRRSTSEAARRGQTLQDFVNDALKEKLAPTRARARSVEPEWMRGFGTLRKLHKETERIEERIRQAFEVVEPTSSR